MKNEKKFLIPEAVLIKFNDEDIIVTSGEGDYGDTWGENPGDEYHD